MLDIKLVRSTPDLQRGGLRKRGRDAADVDEVLALDAQWRDGLKAMEGLRAERNKSGKLVADAKKAGQDPRAVLDRMAAVAADLKRLEAGVPAAGKRRALLRPSIPTLMPPSVPVGKDDTENVEVRPWGGKPVPPFPAV